VRRSCAHNSCLQRFRERRRESIGSCSVKAAAQHPLGVSHRDPIVHVARHEFRDGWKAKDSGRRFNVNSDKQESSCPPQTTCVKVAHQPSAERQQRTYQSTAHKKKKYKDLCEANNWDLAPLVFSSFGHPTSQKTVKWLRTFASISKTPGTFRKLMHVCSIAVVCGNHDIISLLLRRRPILLKARHVSSSVPSHQNHFWIWSSVHMWFPYNDQAQRSNALKIVQG
jgi:hypothetical protein